MSRGTGILGSGVLHAFDDEHVEVSSSLADPARLGVLRRGVPALGLIYARKLDHDQPRGQPGALQCLHRAATLAPLSWRYSS